MMNIIVPNNSKPNELTEQELDLGQLAHPIVLTQQEKLPNGNVITTTKVFGGLTKIQDMASTILAGFCSDPSFNADNKDAAIQVSVEMAVQLYNMTQGVRIVQTPKSE